MSDDTGRSAEELHRAAEERRRAMRDAPRTGAMAPADAESPLDELTRRSDMHSDPQVPEPTPHEGMGPGIGDGTTVRMTAPPATSPEEAQSHPSLRPKQEAADEERGFHG